MSVSYSEIRLREGAEDVIKNICIGVLREISKECIERVLLFTSFWNVEDGTTIRALEDYYTGKNGWIVSTDNAGAFIMEFGSGEYMDTSNPDLQNYRNSTYWNPLRKNKTIVGRPEGEYMGVNYITGQWEERYSTGSNAGKKIGFFKGEKANPQIQNMIDQINTLLTQRMKTEGYSRINDEMKRNTNNIFEIVQRKI